MKNVSNKFNLSEEELELIDNYLRNRLSGNALSAFNNRLQSDEDWKKKVEEVKLISLGISQASLEEKLSEFHRDITMPEIVTVKDRSRKKWLAAASVIGLMIISTVMILSKPEHEKLYGEYYKPDPGLPVVMSEGKSNYTLYDGMIYYKEGNYAKAIEKWNTITDKTMYADTLNYYMGVAGMNAGNMELAITYLDKIAKKENSPYRQKAIWYLALMYIKQNNIPAAEPLLKKIDHIPEAKELLQRLSR